MRNDAMRGLATGNREGKPVGREQQIHTPDVILDVCEAVWGNITLDPCASGEHSCRAQHEYFSDGLEATWMDCCFVNPPYKHLESWLEKSCFEWNESDVHEQILLFPVRPNRSWWCRYMSDDEIVASVAWLKPLKFVGFKSAFPAPLCLVYTGKDVVTFEEAVRTKGIAHHIGMGI